MGYKYAAVFDGLYRTHVIYEKRLDKDYSLTDCISILTMKTLNIREILTHDNHFEQEGFTILL